MAQKWCTIESDPGVFTELIQEIGVKGVQVEELMTLEDDELNKIQPIHGLIFLFKWVPQTTKPETLSDYDPELFFANQVINNACATQAILSILMNRPEIEIGSELTNLRGFSQGLPSKDKGHAIGNSEKIRVAHNSFTRQDPFVMDEEDKPATKDSEDVFHFISFVPHNNTLYELDGLQAGPISHGECSDDTWLALAREQIQQRIENYASNEIRFNLLAVIGDQIVQLEKEKTKLATLQQWIAKKQANELEASVASGTATDLGEYEICRKEILELAAQSNETLEASLAQVIQTIGARDEKIDAERQRQANWKSENERRRHNYVPVIFELLKQLAKKKELKRLFDEAKERKEKKNAEKSKTATAGTLTEDVKMQ